MIHLLSSGFWDFTADLASRDTAYTSLALRAHTDTTYFTDPCGLQMFHLLSHTEGSGGASLLVDGFAAANQLKKEAPEAYETLSRVRVPTHASGNEDISIQPTVTFPVLNHHPQTGELEQVRWNNDDRATMDQWESETELEEWYDAARKWSEILRREENEYWEQLRPGRPMSLYSLENYHCLIGMADDREPQSLITGESYMAGQPLPAKDVCVAVT
ncbi:MAG: hypothetical protein M1833_002782 [Piccolia ochrophora]|nr:MAG: hypothetical protein M1833_002782 [Piccolia ochrophora]